MPKGVPRLASAPPETVVGQKVGSWYFNGYELTPPPWQRPSDYGELGWAPSPDRELAIRISLARGPSYKGPPVAQGDDPDWTQPTEWVQLVACYRPGEPHPSAVVLFGDRGVEVGPEMLRRFPWKTWMTVADAAYRQSLDARDRDHDLDVLFAPGGASGTRMRRRVNRRTKAPAVKRPGRAGHDDAFYIGVAERYRELRLQGSPNPTQRIAQDSVVSRSTAAGWVRRAREKGFLAPGRRGRPG